MTSCRDVRSLTERWRGSRRIFASELRKLRERSPRGHAFAPAEIGRSEAARSQAFLDFVFGKNPEFRFGTRDVDVGHGPRF